MWLDHPLTSLHHTTDVFQQLMSSSGLPSTMTRSAWVPGVSDPTLSFHPINSAAQRVALWMAWAGLSP